MASFVVTKKPPDPQVILAAVRVRGKRVLKKHGQAHVRRRREIVRPFQNKNRPTFRHQTTENDEGITLTVTYRDKTKRRTIWKWLSITGTKPHTIVPKRKPFLVFNWGGARSYLPRTAPGNPPSFGGPGQVIGGQTRRAKAVKHPGFPPRKFDESINKDLEPGFRGEISKALVRGIRDGLK